MPDDGILPPDTAALDEGAPVLPDDHEAPQFATVRLVEVQRQGQEEASAWQDAMQGSQACPLCRRYKLKRQKSRVYCHFCRHAWWSRHPKYAKEEAVHV